MPRHVYRAIKAGVETMAPALMLPRHRHRAGYATVVLAGSFVEAGFAGRFTVGPGDVLLHGRFDCHQNISTSRRGPQILRLPWNDDSREGCFRIDDADLLARLAERDLDAAVHELETQLRSAAAPFAAHWCSRLASDLMAQPELSLEAWSETEGLAPATLSRGFRRVFGTTPKQFRLEARTRRAWSALVATSRPLTAIAYDFGFADLSHLSRSVHAFTGSPPSGWRQPSSTTDPRRLRASTVKSVQAGRGGTC
jgi:AraC-like DNA-binding protein